MASVELGYFIDSYGIFSAFAGGGKGVFMLYIFNSCTALEAL
ncbi:MULTISPECIES: hypothetical protein [Pseudomonas]|nr:MULTISPECIES: hypothetical protein [Pseudomonas]